MHQVDRRPGDWDCPSCQHMNFASRDQCRACGTPKPHGQNQENGDRMDSRDRDRGDRDSRDNRDRMDNRMDNRMDTRDRTDRMDNRMDNRDRRPRYHEKRPGDWDCPACNHLNFARRDICRSCGLAKEQNHGSGGGGSNSASSGGSSSAKVPSDWVCFSCQFNNFGRNRECMKCGLEREPEVWGAPLEQDPYGYDPYYPPPRYEDNYPPPLYPPYQNSYSRSPYDRPGPQSLGGMGGQMRRSPLQTMKQGDWVCHCGELVFASRLSCRKCGAKSRNHQHQQNHYNSNDSYRQPYSSHHGGGHVNGPGEWICQDCNEVCVTRSCRNCGGTNGRDGGGGGLRDGGGRNYRGDVIGPIDELSPQRQR